MGCGHSRPTRRVEPAPTPRPAVVFAEKFSTPNLEPQQSQRVSASRAAWVADTNFGDYVRIVAVDEQRLFVCLFDPHTTHDAAAFCVGKCTEIFVGAMKKCVEDPGRALQLTVEKLDQQFLTSNLSPQVRALSGCSAVLAFIDKGEEKCWVANVGTSQCLIGISEGAFNSKTMSGKAVVSRHDAENPEEQERLRHNFPSENEILLKNNEGKMLIKGITKMARCIGYGFAKDPKLAAVYNKHARVPINPLPDASNPYVLTTPQVEVCDLSTGASKLIIYSEGMSQLLSPSEMAVFTMHFDEFQTLQLIDTYLTSDSEADVNRQLKQGVDSPATALIQHAVCRAADNLESLLTDFQHSVQHCLSKKQQKWELLGLEDMRSLKVKHEPTFDRQLNAAPTSLCRKDLHGNLACVVIALEKPEKKSRLLSLPSRSSAIPPLVLYRWKLVQLFCKYHIQKRRACRRRWWNLIALAVRNGQQQLLDNERAEWYMDKREESAASAPAPLLPSHIKVGQMSDLEKKKGKEALRCNELPKILHSRIGSGIRKWLDTPSRKGMGSLNDADFSANKVLCL